MKEIQRLYDIRERLLKVYELSPNIDRLEEAKRAYIESADKENLLYEINCRDIPSWQIDNFQVPVSKLNGIPSLFSASKESWLRPIKDIPRHKKHLMEVYCKSDLLSPDLKMIYDDRTRETLYYFLFLTEQYKDGYKTHHYDSILSLNREMFMYELLLNGQYQLVDPDSLGNVREYFSLSQLSEIPMSSLFTLDRSIFDAIMEKEKRTFKLVRKING